MCKLLKNLFIFSALVLATIGCSDDDEYGYITLSQSTLYFTEAGETSSITFATSNMTSVYVYSFPEGWDAWIHLSSKTLYVTAPDDISDDTESDLSGSVVLSGGTTSGSSTTATLTVDFAERVDINSQVDNSIFLNTPNYIYYFDATQTVPGGETISPASVSVLWQTSPTALAYAKKGYYDDTVELYLKNDSYDYDEDGVTDEVVNGNAVIAAYDSDDEILWTWHIWVSDNDYGEVTINGKTYMDRNLGAFANSNDSTDDILDSYGLYYQWGRKHPFIYPSTYNASGGTIGSITGNNFVYAEISYEESDADVGTLEYAMENPLSFILGVEESSYDWLYSDHDTSLWGSTKTIYDPCPKGWRVPDADAYVGLTIATPYATESEREDITLAYGWELTDGATTELFMGLGRWNYLTGTFQNVFPQDDYSPWVGNYWTLGTSSGNYSSSFYFTYDLSDYENNALYPQYPAQRANGMQIRCQKE